MSGATSLSPGAIFAGDYRIVGPLSEGGFGSVYVAEQLSTGAKRALKLMHADLVADDQLLRLFEQEARIGSRIKSDHVVQVIDAGVDDDTRTPWLAMELLDGEALSARLDRLGLLPHAMVIEILSQVCHGLAAAHSVDVVHRDIKPENIFIASPQHDGIELMVKILDFGIARLLANASARAPMPFGTLIGTPLWMAPEQANGQEISTAADVWAIGLLAFRLLTGRRYWTSSVIDGRGIQNELLHAPIVSASARAKEYGCADRIPAEFDGWFARCVARDHKARFANAGLARERIREALDLEGPTPQIASMRPWSVPWPPSSGPNLSPQPAGAAYDPRWYIPRVREEREALNHLGFPGTPAVLFGPNRSGKTWLLGHCIAQLEQQGDYESIVINFGLLDRGSLDRLAQGLAAHILQLRNLDPPPTLTAWKGYGSPLQKLTRLMDQDVLPRVKGALVLALDDVDAILGTPFQDAIFALLRAWAETCNDRWSKLRLLLAVSTTPAQLINDPNYSPFNLTAPIVLDGFSTEQVEDLERRYRLGWSPRDIERVMALVGRHPYLIRLLMHGAALHETPIEQLLDRGLGPRWILSHEVRRIRASLQEKGVLDLAARIANNPAILLDPDEAHRLVRSGVAVQGARGVVRLRDGLHAIAALAPA